MALVVVEMSHHGNISDLPPDSSWLYRATSSAPLEFPARQLAESDYWREQFQTISEDVSVCIQRLRGFKTMRYINRLFTYLHSTMQYDVYLTCSQNWWVASFVYCKESNRKFKWKMKTMSMISLVQSSDLRRQSRGYQKSVKVGRICWKGRFGA